MSQTKINKSVTVKSKVIVYKRPTWDAGHVGYLEPLHTYSATKMTESKGWYYISEKGGWAYYNFLKISDVPKPSSSKKSTSAAQDAIKKAQDAANKVAQNAVANGTLTPNGNGGYSAGPNASSSGTAGSTAAPATVFDNAQQRTVYESFLNDEFNKYDEVADGLLVDNLNGVYGIPYQWPESVDPKLPNTGFGSIYAERIVDRMPLLMMSPGKVSFMRSYSDGEKSAVLDALAGASSGASTAINDFLKKPGKYYSFEYDSASYWQYVNTMNHACAAYLGIEDVVVNINGVEKALSEFKWEEATNSKFDSLLLSSKDYICFYTDADTTKNESFSNSTAESQLYSSINSASDYARELRFILGTQSGVDFMDNNTLQRAMKSLGDTITKLTDGQTLINNIKNEFVTIATGGKLMFPQIWSDSEFDQSFDVKIKLRCPCPNKISWYLDIIVPINHLIALTMPRIPTTEMVYGNNTTATRTTDSFANGYMTPFLVRAFYKGLFNCDMGIITSLNISKGKEGSWTLDGLPTEVDIDLTIKDLYNQMAMATENQGRDFLANTTFLNYMANACGISINKPDLERSVTIWMMTKSNKWKNQLSGYNWRQRTSQTIRNKIFNLYTGVFNY